MNPLSHKCNNHLKQAKDLPKIELKCYYDNN